MAPFVESLKTNYIEQYIAVFYHSQIFCGMEHTVFLGTQRTDVMCFLTKFKKTNVTKNCKQW